MNRRARAFSSFAALVSFSRVCEAETDGAQARALYTEAVAYMADGRTLEACAKLESSLKLAAALPTRSKLAECYEKAERYASAWSTYRELAQLANRASDTARETWALEKTRSLESKLSYLTVVVGPAQDLAGLVIKRDGREVDRAHYGKAERLDAKTVHLELTALGHKPRAVDIVLHVGESLKFDVPLLEREPPPEAPKAAPTSAAAETENDDRAWQKPVALAAGAAGVVLIGVGAALGLSARSTYDEAFAAGGGCDRANRQCSVEGQDKIDDARLHAAWATATMIGGAGFLAAGAVMFFTAPSGRPSQRASMRITPTSAALRIVF